MRFATLCLLLWARLASGSIIDGSISFTSAVDSYVGPNLSSATSITLVPGTGSITTALGAFAALVHLFPDTGAVASLDSVTFVAPLPALTDFVKWADNLTLNRFAFSVLSSSVGHVSLNDLEIFATGRFTDKQGAFDSEAATLLVNLTQTGGPGTAVSLSGTISLSGTEPLQTEIPEPSGLAIAGLAGLALWWFFLRRRVR